MKLVPWALLALAVPSSLRILFCWCLAAMLCLETGVALGLIKPYLGIEIAPSLRAWWVGPALSHSIAAVGLWALLVLFSRPLFPALRIWLIPLLSLAAAGLFLIEYKELERVVSTTTDFGTIYTAVRDWTHGQDPYATGAGAFFYPPTTLLILAPITVFNMAMASVLWFTFKVFLLTLGFAVLWRSFGFGALSPERRFWAGVLMVLAPARFWITDLQYGNTNIVVAVLVIFAATWAHRFRGQRAGLSLALSTGLKLTPGFLGIHMLAVQRWRVLAGAAAVLVFLVVLVTLLGNSVDSFNVWQSYREVGVADKLGGDLSQPDNQSLYGALYRLKPPGPVRNMLWLLCAGFLMGWAFLTSRRSGVVDQGELLAMAMYPLLMLLLSPGTWVVHYASLIFPLTALLWLGMFRGGGWFWGVYILVNLVFSGTGLWRWSVALAGEYSLFVFCALLMLPVLSKGALDLARARRA